MVLIRENINISDDKLQPSVLTTHLACHPLLLCTSFAPLVPLLRQDPANHTVRT
ncbi:hypothetical protein I79_006152 [Cricetulus griseus]|uniref:Uncharacterized protein n=1 Tax=Cricetulus griseus TaxID=10029 RepID=G3H727_CRIGR|nr:hypothetical protein I79_006152 [Cricetulus griseus]